MLFASACGGGGGGGGQATEQAPAQEATEAPKQEAASESSSATDAEADEPAEVSEEIADVQEITKISWFTIHGNVMNGDITGRNRIIFDHLREKLHVEFEIREIVGTERDQVYQTMLASRDMTDLVNVMGLIQANQTAEAGLFMDLNTKKDLLPNLFGEPIFQSMNRYISDLNNGALYYLFSYVGKSGNADNLPKIRWDLYDKLGKPAIDTMEDLVPLFQDMIALEPEREDGSKNYGIGFFPSWDSPFHAGVIHYLEGIYGRNYTPNFFVQVDGDVMSSRYADGSHAYRMINWLFLCNQAGVLDPDSPTQTWEMYNEKMTNGSIMMSLWPWHGSSNILNMTEDEVEGRQGYAPFIIGDATLTVNPDNLVGNQSRMMGAGYNACDAALRVIDYLYSYEGSDIMNNGFEGIHWTFDENGDRRGFRPGEPQHRMTTEEVDEAGESLWVFDLPAFNDSEISRYGDTMSASFWETNIRYGAETAVDPIMSDWRATFNVISFNDFVSKTPNAYKVNPAVTFMAPPPEDIEMIMSQIGDVVKTNTYKMIMAANRGEFDALWDDLKAKADAYGLQEVLDWSLTEWENAKSTVDKYR